MNTLKLTDFPDFDWEDFIDSYYQRNVKDCTVKFIYQITDYDFPNNSELWGYWETNEFDEYEIDDEFPPHEHILILHRTELKTETVIRKFWSKII